MVHSRTESTGRGEAWHSPGKCRCRIDGFKQLNSEAGGNHFTGECLDCPQIAGSQRTECARSSIGATNDFNIDAPTTSVSTSCNINLAAATNILVAVEEKLSNPKGKVEPIIRRDDPFQLRVEKNVWKPKPHWNQFDSETVSDESTDEVNRFSTSSRQHETADEKGRDDPVVDEVTAAVTGDIPAGYDGEPAVCEDKHPVCEGTSAADDEPAVYEGNTSVYEEPDVCEDEPTNEVTKLPSQYLTATDDSSKISDMCKAILSKTQNSDQFALPDSVRDAHAPRIGSLEMMLCTDLQLPRPFWPFQSFSPDTVSLKTKKIDRNEWASLESMKTLIDHAPLRRKCLLLVRWYNIAARCHLAEHRFGRAFENYSLAKQELDRLDGPLPSDSIDLKITAILLFMKFFSFSRTVNKKYPAWYKVKNLLQSCLSLVSTVYGDRPDDPKRKIYTTTLLWWCLVEEIRFPLFAPLVVVSKELSTCGFRSKAFDFKQRFGVKLQDTNHKLAATLLGDVQQGLAFLFSAASPEFSGYEPARQCVGHVRYFLKCLQDYKAGGATQLSLPFVIDSTSLRALPPLAAPDKEEKRKSLYALCSQFRTSLTGSQVARGLEGFYVDKSSEKVVLLTARGTKKQLADELCALHGDQVMESVHIKEANPCENHAGFIRHRNLYIKQNGVELGRSATVGAVSYVDDGKTAQIISSGHAFREADDLVTNNSAATEGQLPSNGVKEIKGKFRIGNGSEPQVREVDLVLCESSTSRKSHYMDGPCNVGRSEEAWVDLAVCNTPKNQDVSGLLSDPRQVSSNRRRTFEFPEADIDDVITVEKIGATANSTTGTISTTKFYKKDLHRTWLIGGNLLSIKGNVVPFADVGDSGAAVTSVTDKSLIYGLYMGSLRVDDDDTNFSPQGLTCVKRLIEGPLESILRREKL